jgi:hypothetical protein
MEHEMIKKIVLAAGLMTSVLWADFTLEYKMEGNMKQVVQYKDAQHVLITTQGEHKGESSGQLIVGDKKFMLMQQGGKTKYMDMDVMMQQMKQFAGMAGTADSEGAESSSTPEFKIVYKGTKKKMAGIEGQVWILEVNAEGKKEHMDVVVTENDNVVDAVKKYSQIMKQFTDMGNERGDALSSLLNIKDGYAVIGFEGMQLVKYSDADIPDTVFALPAGMNVGTKIKNAQKKHVSATVKKPPLCPMVGTHGRAKQLSKMLKSKADGWKLIENASCINMMNMQAENAIYQKGNGYIHINLSINVEGENGMIAKYKMNHMKVSHLKRGKIQGMRYQSGLLESVGQNVMDIKLPNAMLTLTATQNVKDDLDDFAKEVLDLSKFAPVKKSKPSADDALKSLGAMLGGGGSSSKSGGSAKDAKAAEEMLKGLFGK